MGGDRRAQQGAQGALRSGEAVDRRDPRAVTTSSCRRMDRKIVRLLPKSHRNSGLAPVKLSYQLAVQLSGVTSWSR
jgi:hypothetical protein